jgi:asparagine synthase (glutamine-hydrolysing)
MQAGHTHLIVNGEIYNFRELARQHNLSSELNSRSDSEVLIRLIERIGMERTLDSIDGMYAFAAYDSRNRLLHLVRDPFGVKPLFVLRHDGCIWFASEIKALLAVPGFVPTASPEALHHFLSLDYIPGAVTAFEGIEELRPGAWWSISTETGAVTRRQHAQTQWAIDDSITLNDAIAQSQELLTNAVSRQLVADVDVGVMLSGGLDSSSIAALTAKVRGNSDFHTFSIGFDDPSFNESHHAATVAKALGTQHHTILIGPSDVERHLESVVTTIDEPYADGSAIPTALLSAHAKEYVTVLLSGEGGDEMFSGYDTHAASVARAWYRRLPQWLRTGVISPAVQLLPVRHNKLSFDFKAKRFAQGAEFSPAQSHFAWRVVIAEEAKSSVAILPDGMTPTHRLFEDAFDECTSSDGLQKLLHVDRSYHLPDDLMVKNDRMTMMHSIEARVPFCDRALVNYLARVPSHLLMKGLTPKRLLRLAMRGVLPPNIIKRKKMGLEMPYSTWMRGPLNGFTRSVLDPDRVNATGMLRSEGVTALLDDHCAMKVDHGRALWGLINWVLWHERYIQTRTTS